jgi:hypothetical protein
MGAPGAGVGNLGNTARFSTVFVGVTCGCGDSGDKMAPVPVAPCIGVELVMVAPSLACPPIAAGS